MDVESETGRVDTGEHHRSMALCARMRLNFIGGEAQFLFGQGHHCSLSLVGSKVLSVTDNAWKPRGDGLRLHPARGRRWSKQLTLVRSLPVQNGAPPSTSHARRSRPPSSGRSSQMSVFNHSRPNWWVRAMSALSPIATELRTSWWSVKCHEQTSSALFDHLVGGQQHWRHIAPTNRRRLTQHC